MCIILEKPNCFWIQFDFNKRINREVVKLPNAKYDSKYKRWEVDLHGRAQVESFAQKFGFDMPGGVSRRKIFDEPIADMPKLEVKPELLMTLRDYQEEGVAFSMKHGSVLNGDSCGLGKSAQAIATIIAKDLFPCLIICPANLKLNWEIEVGLWTDKHKALVLSDSTKHTWPVFWQMKMFDIFIVNYESLQKYFVVKTEIPHGEKFSISHVSFHPNINLFKSSIIDECHRVADSSTRQSKLTYGVTLGKELNLLLSGTPIVNKPIDLLSQLMIIDKIKYFGGVSNFRAMCADSERWPEINYILRTHCFFRREKKSVLKELPDLTRQKVFCEITNQGEYDIALADLERYYKEWKQATDSQIARSMRAKALVQLGVLKSVSARGKLADFMEYANDVIASGEKLLVFIYLDEVVQEIKKAFPDALFYTGKENEAKKNAAIHEFQRCTICDKRFERHGDEDHEFSPTSSNLIFVNYKAGGVGITLTAASIMVHLELPWTPKDVEQDEGRLHRMSQKNAVQNSFFIGKGTVDEYVYQIIADKREMSNMCTGAEDGTEESVMESVMDLLFKK